MVSIFFWVAFGSLIGWIAALLQDEPEPQRMVTYAIAGAVGGLLGGFGGLLLNPGEIAYRSSTTDLMFAVFGATIFVLLASLAAPDRFRE